MTVVSAILAAAPLYADTVTPQQVIEFSPGDDSAGSWEYNGAGILSFNQDISVDSALTSNADALVGAKVYLPTFQVGSFPGEPYTLTPLGNSEVSIRSADGSTMYFTGTLHVSDLSTVGTVAGGYTGFQVDITDFVITHEGAALGSAALDILATMKIPSLDFELSLQGGSGPGFFSFADMIDGAHTGTGGFSGAMSIPEPMTAVLLGLGGWTLMRKRTQH
jgi:hypothetical protein